MADVQKVDLDRQTKILEIKEPGAVPKNGLVFLYMVCLSKKLMMRRSAGKDYAEWSSMIGGEQGPQFEI